MPRNPATCICRYEDDEALCVIQSLGELLGSDWSEVKTLNARSVRPRFYPFMQTLVRHCDALSSAASSRLIISQWQQACEL